MKRSLLILAALSVIAFAGCKTTKVQVPGGKAVTRMTGEWLIQSLTGFDSESLPKAYMNNSLVDDIDAGKVLSVTGFSGVNQFFGSVKVSEGFPMGESMGSTRMMGSPEDMEFEDTLIHLLATAENWEVSGYTLTITDGTTTAVFYTTYRDEK